MNQPSPEVLQRMVAHLGEQLAQAAQTFAFNVAQMEERLEKAEAEIQRLQAELARAKAT